MKKFISLLLVFSVLLLSVPLTAKEKKGADLIIQRIDGTHIRGELIAVKENSLLLLARDSGADVTVDIEDIRMIRIKGKSKALIGAGLGLLIGVGNFIATIKNEQNETAEHIFALMGGAGIVLIGAIVGAVIKKDKTFQIEGKSDSEIQEILEKLRKKARIRNSQ